MKKSYFLVTISIVTLSYESRSAAAFDLPGLKDLVMSLPGLICVEDTIETQTMPPSFPEKNWNMVEDIYGYGWDPEGLQEAYKVADKHKIAALMVVDRGRLVGARGCTSARWYIASMRKSLMATTYGKYVESGQINLNSTLGELGIGEKGIEFQPEQLNVTVNMILTSSSGICLPSAASGRRDCHVGQHGVPGKEFKYNNWDFNVADSIFTKQTGKNFYQAFQDDIADPIGMEDYRWKHDGRPSYIDESVHRAYHMYMTTRDLARFGLLMSRRGKWQEQQVVSKNWVDRATSALMPTQGDQDPGGYGHYWWVYNNNKFAKFGIPNGVYFASGSYGQHIFVWPDADLVIVIRGHLLQQKIRGQTLKLPQILEVMGKVIAARRVH